VKPCECVYEHPVAVVFGDRICSSCGFAAKPESKGRSRVTWTAPAVPYIPGDYCTGNPDERPRGGHQARDGAEAMKRIRVTEIACEHVSVVEGPGDRWVLVVRGKALARTSKRQGKPARNKRRKPL